jgi:hypothetical protein
MASSSFIPVLQVEGVSLASTLQDKSDSPESSSSAAMLSTSVTCDPSATHNDSSLRLESRRGINGSILNGIPPHAASPSQLGLDSDLQSPSKGAQVDTLSRTTSSFGLATAQLHSLGSHTNNFLPCSPLASSAISAVAEANDTGSKSPLSQSPVHARANKSAELKLGQFHPLRHPLAQPFSRGVAVDDDPSAFLLERAAKAAQRQIRDQVLSVFPNDDRHLPIAHYIDQAETPAPSSRGSLADLQNVRSNSAEIDLSHHSTLHQRRYLSREADNERREMPKRKLRKRVGSDAMHQDYSPRMTQHGGDREMAAMHRSASPPLLGQDIEFPRSESPPPARFDITQGTEFLRRTVCYLTEQAGTSPPASAGLWSAQKSEPAESSQGSVPVSRTASNCGGLWGNIDPSFFAPSVPVGITTPRAEDEGQLWSGFKSNMLRHLPPSPPASAVGFVALEMKLEAEADLAARIEEELHDGFVTQVYNYLSLGYPAVAREFDEELSKISGIPVEELKQDDHLPTSRGYIRLNDDQVSDGVTEDMCARWKALKLYVREWGKQKPGMLQGPDSMVLQRRGSWGA